MIQTLQWIYFLALPVIIGSWLERCHNASCGDPNCKDPNCEYGKEKPDPDWDAWLKPAIDMYGPKTK